MSQLHARNRTSAEEATRPRSYKWITTDVTTTGRHLQIHPVTPALRDVGKEQCNLISIFGRARQGKSFLMNCLAGETEVFRISNEKESCTQGIDISDKWITLDQFSSLHGGKRVPGQRKIGFIDAEGQGDKDVTYDANLVCPILLTSKCVIFNWKGDLQKDHILSTLGIMTRAAKNVANDGDVSVAKKFGHLHIVFRDWQATDTSTESVHKAIFDPENTQESAIRNQIRQDVLSSFSSIRIWLFDAPTESTKALKNKLSYEITSPTFQRQLQEFRETLSHQLQEPTLFANVPLTGRTMEVLVQSIASSLNSGESILPTSTYVNMMQQEFDKVVERMKAEVITQVDDLIAGLEQRRATNALPSEDMISEEAENLFIDVVASFHDEIQDTLGSSEDATQSQLSAKVSAKLPALLQELKARELKRLLVSYREVLSRWLHQTFPMVQDALKQVSVSYLNRSVSLEAAELASCLATDFSSVMQTYKFNNYSGEIVDEMTKQLAIYWKSLETAILKHNEEVVAQELSTVHGFVEQGIALMAKTVKDAVEQFNREYGNQGYALTLLEQKLNKEFCVFKKQIQGQLSAKLFDNFFVQFRDTTAQKLRPQMVALYEASREERISEMVGQLIVDITTQWQALLSDNLDTKWPCEADLNKYLKSERKTIVDDISKSVSGWDIPNELRPELIENQIHVKLDVFDREILSQYRVMVQIRKEAEEAERQAELRRQQEAERQAELRRQEQERQAEQLRQEEAERQAAMLRLEEIEVNENLPEKKQNAKLTREEQQRRAREYAAQAGWKVGQGKVTAAEKKARTAEEARARALQWATSNLPNLAEAEEEDDDAQVVPRSSLGKAARRQSTDASTKEGKAILLAAKQEAAQQVQQATLTVADTVLASGYKPSKRSK